MAHTSCVGSDPQVEHAFNWLREQGMTLSNGKWRYKDGKILRGMGIVAIMAFYRNDKSKEK